MQVDQEGQGQGDQQNEDNGSNTKVSWTFVLIPWQYPVLMCRYEKSFLVSKSRIGRVGKRRTQQQ